MTNYGSGPTAEDIELFGEDLVQFAQRAAAPVVDRRIGELQRQLTALQNQALQDRVTRALDNDVVTRDAWRRVNVDPDFLRWLDQVDELAGQTRMRLLQSAYADGRDDVVLNIFKGYIVGKLPGRTSERLPYEGDRVSTPADRLDGFRPLGMERERRVEPGAQVSPGAFAAALAGQHRDARGIPPGGPAACRFSLPGRGRKPYNLTDSLRKVGP